MKKAPNPKVEGPKHFESSTSVADQTLPSRCPACADPRDRNAWLVAVVQLVLAGHLPPAVLVRAFGHWLRETWVARP